MNTFMKEQWLMCQYCHRIEHSKTKRMNLVKHLQKHWLEPDFMEKVKRKIGYGSYDVWEGLKIEKSK